MMDLSPEMARLVVEWMSRNLFSNLGKSVSQILVRRHSERGFEGLRRVMRHARDKGERF